MLDINDILTLLYFPSLENELCRSQLEGERGRERERERERETDRQTEGYEEPRLKEESFRDRKMETS